MVIAGATDLDVTPRRCPVAMLSHGAEQTYQGLDHRSWAGGKGRDRISLYLVPRQEIADLNTARYPESRSVVVGCPALDRYTGHEVPPRRVVAFTFHPDYAMARTIPELRSAFPHYEKALPAIVDELRQDGWEVLGHWHPRNRGLRNLWRRLEVEPVEDWDACLSRASVLVADNTSALPEAAAVGLGVVWLDSPEWRRDVDHGARFWDWPSLFGVPGVGEPDEVVRAVGQAWALTDAGVARQKVYSGVWGDATERAAKALREWAS